MITKRLIQLLITVILLIVLAIVGLLLFVDPNRYKEVIVTKVEEQLQRPFAINGNISWRFWPRLGLSIEGIHLGQAKAFKNYHNDTFADIGQASVYVRIAPLLNKQIDVDKLSIQDAKIYLLRQANGTTNWDDLQSQNKNTTTTSAPSTSAEKFKLGISDINIANTQILWDDEAKKQKVTLNIDNIDSALHANQSNPLEATLNIDLQPQNVQLMVTANSHYRFDNASKSYEAQNGQMDIGIKGLDGFKQAQNINVHFDKISADLNNNKVTIDKLKADIFSGHLFIDATGENIHKTPSLQGKVSAKGINPRQIAQAFGQTLHTTDETVLKQLNLDATFKNTDNGFAMDPFTAQLDDSHINGHLNVDQNKLIQFNFNIDKMNLDKYLSGKASATNENTASGKNHSATTSDHKMANLKAKGDLTVGSLILSGLTLNKTHVHLDANNNIVHVAPFKTELYSGTLTSTTTINMQQATPKLNIEATLSNIDIGPFLKEMANNDKFSGRLNFNAQVTASGLDNSSLMKTLNGKAAFNINNGTLNNIDLGYWLAVGENMVLSAKNLSTLAITTAEAAIGKKDTKQTTFSEMSGTFNLQQGIAQNNDLKVIGNHIQATGKGTIDLPKQLINYSLLVSNGQAGTLQIPVKLSGHLKNPSISIDPTAIQALLLNSVGQSLKNTLTGVPITDAAAAGQTIVDTITGTSSSNNSNSNANNNSTTNQSSPEKVIKDTLKGLLGQ